MVTATPAQSVSTIKCSLVWRWANRIPLIQATALASSTESHRPMYFQADIKMGVDHKNTYTAEGYGIPLKMGVRILNLLLKPFYLLDSLGSDISSSI